MFSSRRPRAASVARSVSEYERMIELDPTRADAYAALGGVLVDLNRYEEAEKALTRACELRPDVPEYRIALSAVLAADGAPDQGLAELLGSGRPARGWKQAVAGAVVSFGVGVLVLAAFDDPAVALWLLVTFGGIAYAFRWLRRRWRLWRHRGEMPQRARPGIRTRIRSLTVGLIALALIALPVVVQTEFDRLHSPWNYGLFGGYVAVGLLGFWVDRRRRRRNAPAASSTPIEPSPRAPSTAGAPAR
jgi:tetratricopeptide (TPR) repeat protein